MGHAFGSSRPTNSSIAGGPVLVEGSKTVTHSDWPALSAPLDAFYGKISALGRKLGPILIQLPPKRAFAPGEADRFLSAFRSRTEALIALEPRHASW